MLLKFVQLSQLLAQPLAKALADHDRRKVRIGSRSVRHNRGICDSQTAGPVNLPVLIADPEQIQKVLVNLLLNANDAIGTAGKIAVSTEHHDDWAILAVTDTGAGMSKDFLEHSLFQPFHTTKSKGLGIGLFHSKKIIEAHRGRIEVESELTRGTSFHILLPLEHFQEEVAAA